MEMVSFDTIESDEEEMIRKMILDHFTFTGSDVASGLLKSWKDLLGRFVKVMPMDYKAAIQKKKAVATAQIK